MRALDRWAGFSVGRQGTIAATGTGTVVLVLAVAWWVAQPAFRPLFTNLGREDAAAIVEALRTERVPFRIDDEGSAVLVPSERLYELRLTLASRGLPEGGGVGFESFDRQGIGQTEFQQRLNYQRALQGELARTIGGLGGVESARVHLALPERTVFVGAERRPSASVALTLQPGRSLAPAQIEGIAHLVAASVEGLEVKGVTVVDASGRALSGPADAADIGATSQTALEHQRALERSLAERVETLLGPVVGHGKVMAQVAATLDFARVERTEERYDPDGVVVRKQHSTREPASPADETAPRNERQDEQQEWEVSKVVSRTIGPVGTVTRLSVAVVVDGSYRDDDGVRAFVPRSDDELARLRDLVASAVGASEARGDRIDVASAPFQEAGLLEPAGGPWESAMPWLVPLTGRFLGAGLVAALLFWGVRPLVRSWVDGRREREADDTPIIGERPAAYGQLTRQNVALAERHPERAAQLVREWMRE